MTSVSDGRCTRFGNPPAQAGQKDRIGSDRCVDFSLDRNVERTRLPAENCRHGGGCQAAERPARALRHFLRRQITVCGIIDGPCPLKEQMISEGSTADAAMAP